MKKLFLIAAITSVSFVSASTISDNLDKSVFKTYFSVTNSSGNTSYTIPHQVLKTYKFSRKSPREGGGIEVDIDTDYTYKVISNEQRNYIIIN